MTWWSHWMVGQVDASIVTLALLGLAAAGHRRLSPGMRSALLALALVRLAVPPWLRSPWSEAASDLPGVEGARLAVAVWLQGDSSMALMAATTMGSLILLMRLAWHVRLNRRRWHVSTVAAPPALQARVATLAVKAGSRRVPDLRISTCGDGPLASGVGHPLIVLPAEAVALDADALDAVLAHEVGHHVRHDLAWSVAAECLRAVAWFNPVSHLLARALRSVREEGCDDWAVSHTSGSPTAYGDALMQSARLAVATARPGAVPAHPLGRRLTRLFDERANRSRPLGPTGSAVLIVAATVVLPGATAETQFAAGEHPGRRMVIEHTRIPRLEIR